MRYAAATYRSSHAGAMLGLPEYKTGDEMRAAYKALARPVKAPVVRPARAPEPKLIRTRKPAPELPWQTCGEFNVEWTPEQCDFWPGWYFKNGQGWLKLATPTKILLAIGAAYKFRLHDLLGSSKKGTRAQARQHAAYLMRDRCPGLSFPKIGEILGGRDHSTILHACRHWPSIAHRYAVQVAEVERAL